MSYILKKFLKRTSHTNNLRRVDMLEETKEGNQLDRRSACFSPFYKKDSFTL